VPTLLYAGSIDLDSTVRTTSAARDKPLVLLARPSRRRREPRVARCEGGHDGAGNRVVGSRQPGGAGFCLLRPTGAGEVAGIAVCPVNTSSCRYLRHLKARVASRTLVPSVLRREPHSTSRCRDRERGRCSLLYGLVTVQPRRRSSTTSCSTGMWRNICSRAESLATVAASRSWASGGWSRPRPFGVTCFGTAHRSPDDRHLDGAAARWLPARLRIQR